MKYQELSTALTCLLTEKIITAHEKKMLQEALEAARGFFSDTISLEVLTAKALSNPQNETEPTANLKLTPFEIENRAMLLFATAFLLPQLGAANQRLSPADKNKLLLMQAMISGSFREKDSPLDTLLDSIYTDLSADHVAFLERQTARSKKRLIRHLTQMRISHPQDEEFAKELAISVNTIDSQRVLAWLAASNLSELLPPMPIAKTPKRSLWRWFYDSALSSIRNGFIVGVGLSIAAVLATLAFSALAPYLSTIVAAAIGIGMLVTAVGMIYGAYNSREKGQAQQTLFSKVSQFTKKILWTNAEKNNTAENAQALEESKPKSNTSTVELSSSISNYNFREPINALKRRLYLHSSKAGEAGEQLLKVVAPVMTTGMRPDLITTVITSGLEQTAPRVLRRYWYDDNNWNTYIDFILSINHNQAIADSIQPYVKLTDSSGGKLKGHELTLAVIEGMRDFCEMANCNWIADRMEDQPLSDQQLKMLASINIQHNPEENLVVVKSAADKAYTDEDFVIVRQFLSKVGFAPQLLTSLTKDRQIDIDSIDLTDSHTSNAAATPSSINAKQHNSQRQNQDDDDSVEVAAPAVQRPQGTPSQLANPSATRCSFLNYYGALQAKASKANPSPSTAKQFKYYPQVGIRRYPAA